MHKSDSKFPWTALLAGLAPVLLASPTALQAQPLQGRLVQMQGEVRAAGADASRGQSVAGLLLTTGASGFAQVLMADGSLLALPPGSEIQMPSGAQRQVTLVRGGLALNAACVLIALSGVQLHQFLAALFLLGVGWNFLFTASTTLALSTYRPEEKDKAQGALNFCVFAVLALGLASLGLAACGDAKKAIAEADVAAGDACIDILDLAVGHQLGFLERALDRVHGRIDVGDHALLQPARRMLSHADDLELAIRLHLGDDRHDL